jgi:PAS domain S-box-containing protein
MAIRPEVADVVVVQRDPEQRRGTARTLAQAGWPVTEAGSAEACLEAVERRPDAIVLLAGDLAEGGAHLLRLLAERHPETPVVVMGADATGPAISAMQQGAWDYVIARPHTAEHRVELERALARTLERRRLLRERNRLRDETHALGVAFHGTTDGIAILGPGGRISFVNRALAESVGVPEAVIVGRLLGDLVAVPGDDHALDDILAAVAGGGRWSGTLQARTATTDLVWEVSLTSLPPAAHGPRAVAIFRDVSEKHALEQLRADFLSMVTHDIKVPLTVILGYTEMLSDPEPPPDQVPLDVVSRIRESGEQIHALVCNFLDLSRIEAGRFTIDPRPFDVHAMVAHALEQHAFSARRKSIDLSLQASSLAMVGDEGQLERVMTNLLANAIKYTPVGGSVGVTVRPEGARVVLAVRDTGRGIPAADIPHLFERYRRVREAKRTEGTGLGLFIAKTIVDAHGGEIGVESTPGVGSIFTIVIPGVAGSAPG